MNRPQPLLTPKSLNRIRLMSRPSDIFPSGRLSPMRVVSSLSGDEQPTDSPTCVCPLLTSIFRHWSTLISNEDAERRILPLLPKLVGTNQGPTVSRIRAQMTTKWLTKTYIPFLLDLAGTKDCAAAFRELQDPTELREAVARAREELAKRPIADLYPPDYGLRHPDGVHKSAYEAMAANASMQELAEIVGDLPHLALGTSGYSRPILPSAPPPHAGESNRQLYQLTVQHVTLMADLKYRPSGRYPKT